MANVAHREGPGPVEPRTLLVVDGEPHVVGGRLAEWMRFLLDHARDVNREDLAELALRVNEHAHAGTTDPYWAFRGARFP